MQLTIILYMLRPAPVYAISKFSLYEQLFSSGPRSCSYGFQQIYFYCIFCSARSWLCRIFGVFPLIWKSLQKIKLETILLQMHKFALKLLWFCYDFLCV